MDEASQGVGYRPRIDDPDLRHCRLLLANWMLDDWQFWFRLSDGDKDIFRFAFLAVRADKLRRVEALILNIRLTMLKLTAYSFVNGGRCRDDTSALEHFLETRPLDSAVT